MYADDWRKAAVEYTEWGLAHGVPIPENIMVPPRRWGHRAAASAPFRKPVRLRSTLCCEPGCSTSAMKHPFSLGRCKKHWKIELRRKTILAGVRRREAKRLALDERHSA